jgi:glycosyltransferase involved in cell wall biosynthesis
VIPCCADFDTFKVQDRSAIVEARRRLGLGPDDPVLGYLGSIGTVYMIGDHLRLFAAIKRRSPRAKAVFIGRNKVTEILSIATRIGISLEAEDLVLLSAERDEVPRWLGTIDVGTCFIIPTYSSKGVSPTKLAEYLACGVPVIANAAVGDVEEMVTKLDAGTVVTADDSRNIDAAADAFFELRAIDRRALRERAKPLDLAVAIEAYRAIYRDVRTSVNAGLR